MILASCKRPDIVLYLSSILVKIYLHATIYITRSFLAIGAKNLGQ